MLARILLTLAITAVATSPAAETHPSIELVERLQAAFNEHDVMAMAKCVTSDIAWYSVNGGEIAAEAVGKTALIEGMNAYFDAIPTARSETEHAYVSGKYVIARERAFWEQEGVTQSQSSLAIYEIEDNLIVRVWYYPAEK